MSTKAENVSQPLDWVKWLLIVLVLGGLIYAYQMFSDEYVLYSAIGAVAAVVVAGFIAATTVKGKTFLAFAKDARTEVRKVVWPTRQDVVRFTLIILAATAFVGLLLYLADMLIVWVIGLITGIGA